LNIIKWILKWILVIGIIFGIPLIIGVAFHQVFWALIASVVTFVIVYDVYIWRRYQDMKGVVSELYIMIERQKSKIY